jgi:hypothetical protein
MSDRREITKAKPKHRRPSAAARKGQRAVVVTVTGGMAAGGFVASAGSAMADHTTVSQAQGYFLSGNVASLSLKDLLPTASAVNKSHDTTSSVVDTQLGINLGSFGLPSVPLPGLSGVNLFGSGGVLDVGVLNEYARAKGDGSSYGASGAVTSTGAIGSGTPNQNATIDLSKLLGGSIVGTVADLNVQVGALAAAATQNAAGATSGDYKIANLVVNLQSPALATILTTLDGVLTTVDTTLGTLPVVGGLAVPGVSLTNLPDLTAVLGTFNNSLLDGSDGISIDPATGTIAINVSSLVNLNNLPPNTNLVPYILGALDGLVSGALTNLTTGVQAQLTKVIGSTLLGVPLLPLVQPVLDAALGAVITPLVTTATGALSGAATGQAALLDAGTGGLIGDILNGVLDLVANVQQTAGAIFTERALSVGLALPVLAGNALTATDLALVNLASASVGPNAGVAALAPPVITAPKDGSETTDTTPPISGTGVAGATVTVKEGSKTLCTAVVASNGKWTCTSAKLALGSHTISATQALGGRTSAKSNVVTFKVVATTPTTPGSDVLPATGGNGNPAPLAAAGLGLLLGGLGLTAAPRLARHGGGGSAGGGAHARGGRHAKR